MKSETLVLNKNESWKIFDEIAPRYDLLNDMLSLGMHMSWKRLLKSFFKKRQNQQVLDIATGTADCLLASVCQNPNISQAFGIDLSQKMLEEGKIKVKKRECAHKITLSLGDANHLPFNSNKFDQTMIAFGIRNLQDPLIALKEMYRVLKPDGRSLILEFSLPKNPGLKFLYLIYLRNFVPLIGLIFSGQFEAYKYLNKTIETFPYGENFCRLMKEAGFDNIHATMLCFGVATIYQGDKYFTLKESKA